MNITHRPLPTIEAIPYVPDPSLIAKAREGLTEFKAKRDDTEINEWFIEGDKA